MTMQHPQSALVLTSIFGTVEKCRIDRDDYPVLQPRFLELFEKFQWL